jgi:hypothetical protein
MSWHRRRAFADMLFEPLSRRPVQHQARKGRRTKLGLLRATHPFVDAYTTRIIPRGSPEWYSISYAIQILPMLASQFSRHEIVYLTYHTRAMTAGTSLAAMVSCSIGCGPFRHFPPCEYNSKHEHAPRCKKVFVALVQVIPTPKLLHDLILIPEGYVLLFVPLK